MHEHEEDISNIEPYDIILECSPDEGSKSLFLFKKTLGIDMSIGELLKGSKQAPFIIQKNVPFVKAKFGIEKLGDIGKVLKLIPSKTL